MQTDAQRTSGTRARLEKNGEALLRSVCKLAHDGHLCYEKGESAEIRQWMAEKYPEHVWVSVGRVELSKRQDWCCECSEKVLPLIDPLRDYLVHQLVLDSNVLKDSTLQRLELRQFAAYVHTLAVMWLVVFEELRALTNSTIIKLNPMELPQLCDHLWKFADVLVGPNPLSVMEPNYRPWPKLRGEGPDTKEMYAWYANREKMLKPRRVKLRAFRERHSGEAYTLILKELFLLMGKAIHTSLRRTMGNYLESTNGIKRNSTLTSEEKDLTSLLRSENDAAERAFAVLKEMHKRFPGMSFGTLAGVALARLNGTFKCPLWDTEWQNATEQDILRGTGVLSDDAYIRVIHQMCSIREVSAGEVTRTIRENFLADKAAGILTKKQDKADKYDAKIKLLSDKEDKKNTRECVELCPTVAELEATLLSFGNKKGNVGFRKQYLRDQIKARFNREYPLHVVGAEFRKGKAKTEIKWSAPTKASSAEEMDYLLQLAMIMVRFDESEIPIQPNGAASKSKMLREDIPPISIPNTFKSSLVHRQALADIVSKGALALNELVLVDLERRYLGAMFYDDTTKLSYQVVSINSSTNLGHEWYNATSVPVVYNAETSAWEVESKNLIPGNFSKKIYMVDSMQYFTLAMIDNIDKPQFDLSMPDMVQAHNDRAYRMQQQKDCPTDPGLEEPTRRTSKRGKE